MPRTQQDLNYEELQQSILSWLHARLDPSSFGEVSSAFNKFKKEAEDWEVFSLFSKISRTTGKDALMLTEEEVQKANSLRRGWSPSHWSIDQLTRSLLLLGLAERDKGVFLETLDKLFISSDLAEGVALYRSLAILPYPLELKERAAEGIRTNITDVFNAVALHNPYPADFLDEDAWNQLILKSLFIGSPIYRIIGVDQRVNKALAEMLVEYAHERWSAGREVSPELWRCVGPFADEAMVIDISKELTHDSEVHRHAAVLALKESPVESASKILTKYKPVVDKVESGHITWNDIGMEAESDI